MNPTSSQIMILKVFLISLPVLDRAVHLQPQGMRRAKGSKVDRWTLLNLSYLLCLSPATLRLLALPDQGKSIQI